MNIYIMAGGPNPDGLNEIEYNENEDIWIGVDRGVLVLLQNGIVPNYAVGDFDSVTAEELKDIKEKLLHISFFPPEKNETDLEIALDWAVRQKPDTIYILGATGGRCDHFLANIQLLQQQQILSSMKDVEIFLIDEKNSVTVKTPGLYNIVKDSNRKYFSLLSVTKEVTGITLTGFKYPLYQAQLKRGSTLCISNELISDSGNVSFEKGILMMVRSSD